MVVKIDTAAFDELVAGLSVWRIYKFKYTVSIYEPQKLPLVSKHFSLCKIENSKAEEEMPILMLQ